MPSIGKTYKAQQGKCYNCEITALLENMHTATIKYSLDGKKWSKGTTVLVCSGCAEEIKEKGSIEGP